MPFRNHALKMRSFLSYLFVFSLVRQTPIERAAEAASIKARGLDKWPYAAKDYQPDA